MPTLKLGIRAVGLYLSGATKGGRDVIIRVLATNRNSQESKDRHKGIRLVRAADTGESNCHTTSRPEYRDRVKGKDS